MLGRKISDRKLTAYLHNLRTSKRSPANGLNKTGAETFRTVADRVSPPASARALSRGKCSPRASKVSDYAIGSQIGQGAYATVKQGVQKSTGRKVAIKVYEKSKLVDPQRKQSVNREIQLLRRLSHANIVKLYDTIDTFKQLFLVTEFVRGKSLHDYLHLKPARKLEEPEAFMLFRQVLAGIEHCHANSITHRDIKLENVLLGANKEVKIIDFGFSICAPSTQKLKIFCGTPSYMAPEIVNRKEYYGPPVDMWSLGVLLYTMLCGNPPFRGMSDRELFRNISRGQITFPHHVSQTARTIVAQLLQVDPAKRVTAAEVTKVTKMRS